MPDLLAIGLEFTRLAYHVQPTIRVAHRTTRFCCRRALCCYLVRCLGHAWTDRRTRFNTLADTRSASYSVNMAKRARSKIGNRAVGT